LGKVRSVTARQDLCVFQNTTRRDHQALHLGNLRLCLLARRTFPTVCNSSTDLSRPGGFLDLKTRLSKFRNRSLAFFFGYGTWIRFFERLSIRNEVLRDPPQAPELRPGGLRGIGRLVPIPRVGICETFSLQPRRQNTNYGLHCDI
jgi:hypothetical protein